MFTFIWRILFPWHFAFLLAHLHQLPRDTLNSELRGKGFYGDILFRPLCSKISPSLSLNNVCLYTNQVLFIYLSLLKEEMFLMIAGSNSLSIENSISHLITMFFFFFKASIIWLYPRSLCYLVSNSWSSKQCWIWVPSHGIDLKSNQILNGKFHELWVTMTLAYISDYAWL